MSKSEAKDRAYSEAVAARFRLLSLAAVLRNGGEMHQEDRDHLAELLERVAARGEDATAVMIHSDGRAVQRSLTELQAALIAQVEASARQDDPAAKRVEYEVATHIGASLETVRAARRKYGKGVRVIERENTPEGKAVLDALARVYTEKAKSKARKS
jgi:hypothetical protein